MGAGEHEPGGLTTFVDWSIDSADRAERVVWSAAVLDCAGGVVAQRPYADPIDLRPGFPFLYTIVSGGYSATAEMWMRFVQPDGTTLTGVAYGRSWYRDAITNSDIYGQVVTPRTACV